jgi:carboxylesterase type B
MLGHFVLWALLLGLSTACEEVGVNEDGLTVTTATGVYTGAVNPDYETVREFRSIPFAKPPMGKLRWKPPVALRASKDHHYSYRYPASCSQFLLKTLNLFSTNITNYQINTWGQNHHDGYTAQASSEDCLSLAIWTPRNASSDAKLPVAFFLHGGSFVQGGVEVPYELPAGWIDRSQQHIVVSANYRMNVFGFPNAAGLDQQNVGVLDARLALEWTYANIAAFGGDPQRITLWGQSAGAVLADFLSFAWWEDPIASSLYLQSGNAIREVASGDNALQNNFTFVAKNMGCDFPTDPAAELDCMQHVPADLISNFVGTYNDNDTEPGLYFRPTVDEKVLFSNYSDRANAGYIAKIPALETTTANEEASLIAYPKNVALGEPTFIHARSHPCAGHMSCLHPLLSSLLTYS